MFGSHSHIFHSRKQNCGDTVGVSVLFNNPPAWLAKQLHLRLSIDQSV